MYGNSPPGGPQNPPEYKDFRKKASNGLKRFGLLAVIVIAALVLAFGGIYTLNSGEEAVITRWGKYERTETNPGLKFKIPFAEAKYKVNVERIERLQFGSQAAASPNAEQEFTSQAIMLTQEENLVLADWVVQYRISNSYNYLFKVDDPVKVLQAISESAYRRVTAAHPLDDILTNRKDDMQREIMADLQDICNKYEMGILITAVQLQDATPPDAVREAFLDVTRALEDKNAKENEARRYENENLPVARGEASAAINEAEAYKDQRVNEATGAVARYKAIELEYRNQPGVMRTRMYLEMIRDVLPNVDRVYFVDGSDNLLEFLPLGGGSLSANGG